MKLLIDIGNTSAKLAIADGDCFVHFEHLATSWTETFDRLLAAFPIDRCVISTVAGEDPALIAALRKCDLPTLILGIDATPSPDGKIVHSKLSNCKLHGVPKGYGADRLAADLGALALSPGRTLLVIDAGTCITYDLISREGKLIGGVISPGVQLRLKAMHEHTARLPLFEAVPDTPLMGFDTRTCMTSSATHGTRFEIEGYIRHLLPQYPDLQVYLTGGNTFQLADDLQNCVTQAPHLLFHGLNQL